MRVDGDGSGPGCRRQRSHGLEVAGAVAGAEGEAGLLDRSSAPRRVPKRAPADRVRVIELLRRLRMTAAEIAEVLGMALSTVSAILKRIGLGKRSRLEPLEPPNGYECARPGELLHIDVKKLARFSRPGDRILGRGRGRFETAAGYEYLHVCVDDYSRVAYAELLPDERARSAIAFLRRALGFFSARGVTCERILTDNGSAYLSRAYGLASLAFGLRHTRTRPRRPRTNGKAERFIQTMLTEWAYVRLYALPLQLQTTTRQPQPPSARHAAEQRREELHLVGARDPLRSTAAD